MPLANTYKKILALESFDIVKETQIILEENSETIINLVRGQIGSKGKTGKGKPISAKYGPYYSDATVKNKELHGSGLGKVVDHVTMFNTGAFYSTMYLRVIGTKFEILSGVDYFDKINAWNDNSLVELDTDTLMYIRNEILIPQLREIFNKRVNGISSGSNTNVAFNGIFGFQNIR